MKILFKEILLSLAAVFSLAVIVCGFYPLSVWVLAHGLYPDQANGSLIARDGQIIGSKLIGQRFLGPEYFHPRPSAAGEGYDAARSGGSNLGPTSRQLFETIHRRLIDYRTENGLDTDARVPADAVTASASGLDPHISLKNAWLQVSRVAKARGLSETAVCREISACAESRWAGVLGQPRVNVLLLNLALDEHGGKNHGRR